MISMDRYKSAWAEADHMAGLLRAALVRAGVPEQEAARVRGLVTGRGCAYVELGTLPIGSAAKLLGALPPALDDTDEACTLPAEAFR